MDAHVVVVSLLKSNDIAEVHVHSRTMRLAEERVRAGKLTLIL